MIWPTKKLGEIAEIYSGGRSGITKKDYVERGFPAFSAAGQDGFTKEAHDSGFAVILSSIGSRCGKCFYAEGKWTALANTQIIKFENSVTAKFMYYYLNDANKWPKSGTGQPFISPSVVKNLIVPFPPLPIQQKIVKILDTIQSAVEIQEKIIEKTKELKKSLMAELFKYGGPSFRKGRKLKKTDVGEIPEDWEVVRLGEVVIKIKAGGTPNTSEGKYWGGEIAFTLIEDLVNAGKFLVKTNASITKLGLKNSSSWVVPENSIILSLYATVGKPVINKIPVAITQNMIGIIPNKEIIDLEFLYYALENVREKLWKYTDLSVHKHITTSEARKILIPLPPLLEQQEIAEILQTIDQKIEIEKKKKELYEELFKTMLNKIMSGEIMVNDINF
jgi:type I restriction enzyme S subunit